MCLDPCSCLAFRVSRYPSLIGVLLEPVYAVSN